MNETGQPACEEVIRVIVKRAGYRWRKARIVLTSNDPEFSHKLQRIRSILADLKAEEAFFSIDEFGPFAVKVQPGRMLIAPASNALYRNGSNRRAQSSSRPPLNYHPTRSPISTA